MCNLIMKSPQIWRKLSDVQAERHANNPVATVTVMISSVPRKGLSQAKSGTALQGTIPFFSRALGIAAVVWTEIAGFAVSVSVKCSSTFI